MRGEAEVGRHLTQLEMLQVGMESGEGEGRGRGGEG